jgi:hypothetical protein
LSYIDGGDLEVSMLDTLFWYTGLVAWILILFGFVWTILFD